MRKIMQKLTGIALLSGLVFVATSSAATITMDVRIASGGGKSVQIVNPNQVVSLELWAQVANADSNHNNDGFTQAHGSFLSAEGSPALLGNLTGLTFNTNVINSGFSQAGTVQNLDGNADNEAGGTDASTSTDWVVASNGATAHLSTDGAGSGITEFLLGTFTWTGPASVPGGSSSTNVNFGVRNKTNGSTSSKNVYQGQSDGVIFGLNGGTDVTAGNVALGAAVNIFTVGVPEPTTVGLLGLSLLGLAARRRNRIA